MVPEAPDAPETTLVVRARRTPSQTSELPQFEKYEVLERLAVGGMANIFVARQRVSHRPCVLKLLHAHLAQEPIVANRFLREAEVAALLDHPNIARLIDARHEGDAFFVVMDFIPGRELESMMHALWEAGQMLPPTLAIHVALETLGGLHHAHEYRDSEGRHLEIVHRDMSPRNVMITFDGRVQIIDFGLVRANLGAFRTTPGMVLGTLRYMAPEQAVASPADRRADIYSWGVVVYEMLTGRPFVVGKDSSEILEAVVRKVPAPLHALNPNLPRALDGVLQTALAKRRDARFQTALDFRTALASAAGSLVGVEPLAVGDFVARMYPDDVRRARELVGDLDVAHAPSRIDVGVGSALHEPTRTASRAELELRAPSVAREVAARLRSTDPALGRGSSKAQRGLRSLLIGAAVAASALAIVLVSVFSTPQEPVAEISPPPVPRAQAVPRAREVSPEPTNAESSDVSSEAEARRSPRPSSAASDGNRTMPKTDGFDASDRIAKLRDALARTKDRDLSELGDEIARVARTLGPGSDASQVAECARSWSGTLANRRMLARCLDDLERLSRARRDDAQ